MNEPMLWNNLDEAAAWLTGITNRTWTPRGVLDAALKNYSSIGSTPPPSLLKAAPPSDVKFGLYRWDLDKGSPSNPFVRAHGMPWQTLPLFSAHLAQLLATGQCIAGIAKTPESFDGREGEYVFVEPPDQEFKVTLSIVGITGGDLLTLAEYVCRPAKAAVVPPRDPVIDTQEVPADGTSWQVRARAIADELHRSDMAAGAHCSLKDMGDRVAIRMRKHGIYGPRDSPVSGATVKREALQGGLWERPKPLTKSGDSGDSGDSRI